jgi:polyribonucleotide nucleotidyltransferase
MTDIQGPEDEFGDMDFKVAGTAEGVTAIQMDVRVDGVETHILAEALEKARVARLHILETMLQEIATPRASISPRAPQIITLTILPEQIGLVIGGGGKTVNKIKADTGVEEISIEDDGSVFITGKNGTAELAARKIKLLTKVYEIGEVVEVTVLNMTNFGAFAKLDDEHEGLIHISEIAPFHIEKAQDVLHEGDVLTVKIIRADAGKIGLSLKDQDPEYAARKGITPKEVKN